MNYYLMVGATYAALWSIHNIAYVNDAVFKAENELDVSHMTEPEKLRTSVMAKHLLSLLLFATVTVFWPIRMYHDLKE